MLMLPVAYSRHLNSSCIIHQAALAVVLYFFTVVVLIPFLFFGFLTGSPFPYRSKLARCKYCNRVGCRPMLTVVFRQAAKASNLHLSHSPYVLCSLPLANRSSIESCLLSRRCSALQLSAHRHEPVRRAFSPDRPARPHAQMLPSVFLRFGFLQR